MTTPCPAFDQEITAIADYALNQKIDSELAYDIAYYTLIDSMACAILALDFQACTKLLGPVVPGCELNNGVPIPGLAYTLDPVQAAFNIGTMIRWLDFNDTWLAQEWGHPSDNLGAILALGDYCSRVKDANYTVFDILTHMIKAHEIQGVLALENAFNRLGLDHVILVKIASTAVACSLLGNDAQTTANALSNACIDGQALRTYRHAPNTGSRKSWAAGDATSRAVRLSLIAQTGEMGYPSALTAATWGLYETTMKNNPIKRSQDYSSYVMENILWKISFPAEFHAQTAVECGVALHPQIKDRFDEVKTIVIETQEPGMRIINKSGPLHNPADRDHCLQYMSAVALLTGELNARHYEDDFAANPQIDCLRAKMHVKENSRFSKDYLDPNKRAIANAIQVFFNDGSASERIVIDYPIGHRQRREEGKAKLIEKFKSAISNYYSAEQANTIIEKCRDKESLLSMNITDFMDLFTQQ